MSEARRIEQLRAAIDETERLAQRALEPPFVGMRTGGFTDPHESLPAQGEVVRVSILPISWSEGPLAPVYVAFGPEAVLRRCAADRKLLAECEETLSREDAADYVLNGGTGEEFDLARYVIEMMTEGYGVTGE